MHVFVCVWVCVGVGVSPRHGSSVGSPAGDVDAGYNAQSCCSPHGSFISAGTVQERIKRKSD